MPLAVSRSASSALLPVAAHMLQFLFTVNTIIFSSLNSSRSNTLVEGYAIRLQALKSQAGKTTSQNQLSSENFQSDGLSECICDCCLTDKVHHNDNNVNARKSNGKLHESSFIQYDNGLECKPSHDMVMASEFVPSTCMKNSLCFLSNEGLGNSDFDDSDFDESSSQTAIDYGKYCLDSCAPASFDKNPNVQCLQKDDAQASKPIQFNINTNSNLKSDSSDSISALSQADQAELQHDNDILTQYDNSILMKSLDINDISLLTEGKKLSVNKDINDSDIKFKKKASVGSAADSDFISQAEKQIMDARAQMESDGITLNNQPTLDEAKAQTRRAYEFAQQAGKAARDARIAYQDAVGSAYKQGELMAKISLDELKHTARVQATIAKQKHDEAVNANRKKANIVFENVKKIYNERENQANQLVRDLQTRAEEYRDAAAAREHASSEWAAKAQQHRAESSDSSETRAKTIASDVLQAETLTHQAEEFGRQAEEISKNAGLAEKQAEYYKKNAENAATYAQGEVMRRLDGE